MKRWKIEIIATDEAQASQILSNMSESFGVAAKFNLPMESIVMDCKGNKEMSSCELVKTETDETVR